MAATSVTIADALVTAVDAGNPYGAETVRASRVWTPDMDLSELQEDTEPRVTVIPSSHAQSPYDRDRSQWADLVTVDVALRARCLTITRADELASLTEALLDHLRTTVVTDATLPLRDARTEPMYDLDTLSGYQVWFGVLRFTFGLTKQEAG